MNLNDAKVILDLRNDVDYLINILIKKGLIKKETSEDADFNDVKK
jgi:hypothetical protein